MEIKEMAERFNPDEEYDKAMDRTHTIDAILSLNSVFKREYLNTLTTDELHNLEDDLISTQHSS
jgi:hypothetical protein